MSEHDEKIIKPYKIERVCKPHPDIEQLAIKKVDTTESVYTRILIQLKDASLPDVVDDMSEENSRVLTVIVPGGYQPKDPETLPPPTANDPSLPAPNLPPSTSPPTLPPNNPPAPRPPEIVSWDLFLMLKHRQDWRPSGYGLGELVYAISLLPNEEVTMEVKTWETSKTQQDSEDTTDERNVSDIKSSATAANEASSSSEVKSNEYVNGKAGYSGFGVSVSVEAGWSEDVNSKQSEMAKQARDRSQQSTNEYRATRRVRMALSRETGAESKTTRKLKNINQTVSLNANFYELLREYEVSLKLYDVTLVLLGAETDLSRPTKYLTWNTQFQNDFSGVMVMQSRPRYITLGQMIRFSQSAAWVEAFTYVYGESPIKALREMWSGPLFSAALTTSDWSNLNIRITPQQRKTFQSTMLQYVRPSQGWVEPDEKAAFRWAYEVLPGQEDEVLKYLYQFLPYGAQQMVARAVSAGMEPTMAYQSVVARYTQAVIPKYKPQVQREIMLSREMAAAPLQAPESDKILVPGPFNGKSITDFNNDIPSWVKQIITQLNNVRTTLGVIKVEGQESWTTTLPTQGVYADLALGVCSGAEDYFEIQRQFDLERKKLEIKKLELEVEKIRLENRHIAVDEN